MKKTVKIQETNKGNTIHPSENRTNFNPIPPDILRSKGFLRSLTTQKKYEFLPN